MESGTLFDEDEALIGCRTARPLGGGVVDDVQSETAPDIATVDSKAGEYAPDLPIIGTGDDSPVAHVADVDEEPRQGEYL